MALRAGEVYQFARNLKLCMSANQPAGTALMAKLGR
jgi:hypothetical protein